MSILLLHANPHVVSCSVQTPVMIETMQIQTCLLDNQETGALSLQEEVDAGAIIVQEAVPVMVGDTEDSLSERVKEAEHRAFPAALELVASGTVRLGEDNKIHWNTQEQH